MNTEVIAIFNQHLNFSGYHFTVCDGVAVKSAEELYELLTDEEFHEFELRGDAVIANYTSTSMGSEWSTPVPSKETLLIIETCWDLV